MATFANRSRKTVDIWPGFVDALATLLIIIIFILMVFVLGQFFLSQALSGRNAALDLLTIQINEISSMLEMEQQKSSSLATELVILNSEIEASNMQILGLKEQNVELTEVIGVLKNQETVYAKKIINMQTIIDQSIKKSEISAQEIMLLNSDKVKLQKDILALEVLKEEMQDRIVSLKDSVQKKNLEISVEKKLSIEASAQAAMMSQQLQLLREELARLAQTLDASDALSDKQRAQIIDLGTRMNRALAGKVQELQQYRSEFFGKLQQVLGTQPGIQVSGDRFVFQSEVLFASGSAMIQDNGKTQLNQFARTVVEIAKQIPNDIEWVLRVDGHTDDIPINNKQFPSNWELSIARALSVVKYLRTQGIPPNKLVAAGFGEHQPLDPNRTLSARNRNRRIELKLDQR